MYLIIRYAARNAPAIIMLIGVKVMVYPIAINIIIYTVLLRSGENSPISGTREMLLWKNKEATSTARNPVPPSIKAAPYAIGATIIDTSITWFPLNALTEIPNAIIPKKNPAAISTNTAENVFMRLVVQSKLMADFMYEKMIIAIPNTIGFEIWSSSWVRLYSRLCLILNVLNNSNCEQAVARLPSNSAVSTRLSVMEGMINWYSKKPKILLLITIDCRTKRNMSAACVSRRRGTKWAPASNNRKMRPRSIIGYKSIDTTCCMPIPNIIRISGSGK